jgi:hypothetical protein
MPEQPGASPAVPQDDIRSEFLETLRKLEGFPAETLFRLEALLAGGLPVSKDQIRDAIARGKQHA